MALIRNTRSISGDGRSQLERRLTREMPAGCAGLFFGTLVTVAFAIPAWFFFLMPFLQTRAAQFWTGVPCTIVSSRNIQTAGRRPATIFKVQYRYSIDGTSYFGDEYSFWMERTSLLYRRDRILPLPGKFAPGADATCFVNPSNPAQAILDRSLPPNFAFAAMLISLPLTMGVLIAAASLLQIRKR